VDISLIRIRAFRRSLTLFRILADKPVNLWMCSSREFVHAGTCPQSCTSDGEKPLLFWKSILLFAFQCLLHRLKKARGEVGR
jgi:hypothetical protein